MKRRLLLLVGAVALLCTACIKSDQALEMKDDGSGTFTGVIGFSKQFLDTMSGFDTGNKNAPKTDLCKEMVTNAQNEPDVKGGKFEPYKDGDFCGVKFSVPVADAKQAVALLSGDVDITGGAGGGGGFFENVVLEKNAKGWKFGADWTNGGEAGDTDNPFGQQFLKDFSFIFRLKLPGGQTSQNADRIGSDGTMIWNLDPTKPRKLNAVTEAGAKVITDKVLTDAGKNVSTDAGASASGGGEKKSSKTWLWVVLGLAAVAAIAAVVLIKKGKSKKAPDLASGFGAPAAPVGGFAGASAPTDAWAPPASAAPAAPTDAWAAPASTAATPVAAAPVAPAPQAAHAAAAPAADQPQWDAARNAYIQYDRANSRWMQYDQAAGAWKPIE